jgi:hypothetical protein
MSDLVMRVKIALMEVPDKSGVTDVDGEARAAIKAVARWLDTVMDDRVAASDLMKQLKEAANEQ